VLLSPDHRVYNQGLNRWSSYEKGKEIMGRYRIIFLAVLLVTAVTTKGLFAEEYHVSPGGSDRNPGSASEPFETISAAAAIAGPGDLITVHAGTYRERIDPPRGGESDARRITYQAAAGEKAVIKGSEIVRGWKKVGNDTWKVTLPNGFFGTFNPFDDVISGDWFNPKGRRHHTGAVYVNGHWLIEAANLDDVLKPFGEAIGSYSPRSAQYLLNVAWLRPGHESPKASQIAAAGFADQKGIQKAACSEGGECIGWIEQGDWVRYEGIELGPHTEQIEIRAASATRGGLIEIRRDRPDGELLGACTVTNTGGWQAWSTFSAKIKPAEGATTICLLFKGLDRTDKPDDGLWFSEVDAASTTIWAQFKGPNPNEADVEINVRQAVFYPEKPGIDYITVRGFTMMHAATPWAPPTAEQIGLIGTHWSKGWVIENNDIRYSTCTGVTLGKHGDAFDNTSQNSAEGYVKTIERALKRGWSKDRIGHHMVRNNRIAHCEQAGIVGSMGPVFCTVTKNTIHDIHVRRLFTGAEMAGIKFHGAIDTVISHNHIFRTTRGIWLDWMTQGTRVTRNLLHHNGPSEDLFVEVNHGPFMVENNLFLSATSLLDVSEGGAYVHNLFAGQIRVFAELRRDTPYHKAHSTELAGLCNTRGGDDRFYNNIFAGGTGLAPYDDAALPMHMAGNVFLGGARPSKLERDACVRPDFDPGLELVEKGEGYFLQIDLDRAWAKETERRLVTTVSLGRAKIPDLPYEEPDGSPYRIDTDYLGKKRDGANPFPGPFEPAESGPRSLKVWPPRKGD